MGVTARDFMSTQFSTLQPQTPIADAVRVFEKANAQSRQRVFGMMVLNGQGELVGMLSMYDILLLMRPKHIHIWGEMKDLDVSGIVAESCRRAKPVLVGDIMTADVITITPDTHLLLIVDIMLKKHIRRIPVVENGKVVGIVYISTAFHHLLERMID
jgi:CBS domain-containing protein